METILPDEPESSTFCFTNVQIQTCVLCGHFCECLE